MSHATQPVVMGQNCRVELCACGRALVLSVGPLSVRLDVAAAEDVAATLAFAIERCATRLHAGTQHATNDGHEPDEWDVPTFPEPPVSDSN